MRRIAFVTIGMLLLIVISNVSFSSTLAQGKIPPDFYYFEDEKIPITVSTKLISIRFKTNDEHQQREILKAVEGVDAASIKDLHYNAYEVGLNEDLSLSQVIDIVAKLNQFSLVWWASFVYHISEKTMCYMTDELIVTWPLFMPELEINDILRQYQLSKRVRISPYSKTYVLAVSKYSGYSSLALSNKLYEEGYLASANWLCGVVSLAISSDTHISEQWYLKNIPSPTYKGIDAISAWNVVSGAQSVRIAFIDSAWT